MANPLAHHLCHLLAVAALASQAQTPARPAFDVASVKPGSPEIPGGRYRAQRGTLDAKNVAFKLLLSEAYGVDGFHISGGPAWVNSDRFDIEAKAAPGASNADMKAMLRTLLEDRFQLKVHRETKDSPVFVLTIAKGGLKVPPLKEGNCVTAPAEDGQKPVCGAIKPGNNGKNMTMDVVGMDMAGWTRYLSLMLGRTVQDKTGFGERLDAFHFEYTRENLSAGGTNGSDPGDLNVSAALQLQLGLKLDTGKAPAEFLVVDSVEKPSAN